MQQAAREAGLEFASFVRGAVESRAEVLRAARGQQASLELILEERASLGSPVVKAPRREPCVHRLSPASFCKVCDA